MRAWEKKKQYRLMCKREAQAGRINDASGKFINRSAAPDNSMRRDYCPQAR